jgi:hypothetical protein
MSSLLEDVWLEPTVGRALLVPVSELFWTFHVDEAGVFQQFQAKGLPYLSQRYRALLRGFEEVAEVQGSAIWRTQRAAADITEDLHAATGEELRDQFALATLKTIQKHEGLRRLVNAEAPITKSGSVAESMGRIEDLRGNS